MIEFLADQAVAQVKKIEASLTALDLAGTFLFAVGVCVTA